MELVKHNKRTFRQAHYCKSCGVQFVYWGHDKSVPVNRAARGYCSEHDSSSWVPLMRDDTAHVCIGKTRPVEHEGGDTTHADEEPEPVTVQSHVITSAPVLAAVGAPNGHAVNGYASGNAAELEAMGALKVLMETFGSKTATVDESQVRAIVGAMLADAGAMPLRVEVARANGQVAKVKGTANKSLPDVIKWFGKRQNVMLVGPMGTGKSFMAEQVADAFDLSFNEISLNPQLGKHELLGHFSANGEYVRTPFRDWWEFGGVFHFDEFDAGHGAVLTIVNAALAKIKRGGHLFFPDGKVAMHESCGAIASANTFGDGPDRQYQRNKLDAATLDRFVTVRVPYDLALEESVCRATGLAPERVSRALEYIRHLRRIAEERMLPLALGMRRAEALCDGLTTDLPKSTVIDQAVRRGISDEDWRKITYDAPNYRLI